VLLELCRGYDHKESATPAGSVLREVLKVEAAAAVILYDDGDMEGSSTYGLAGIQRDKPQSGNGVFWRFFDWVDKSSFEVAADAFTTFRVGLCRHDLLLIYLYPWHGSRELRQLRSFCKACADESLFK
jgi:calcium binding protein 39